MSGWEPLHSDLRDDLTQHLDPSLATALKTKDQAALIAQIERAHEGVYTLRLLTLDACERLNAEVDRLEEWVEEHDETLQRPNSMNHYGAILDDLGYQAALARLVEVAINPLGALLFPEVGGGSLDSHHGFVVEYGEGRDLDLGFHVDDSEVTVNLCLGSRWEGGELYFRGRRCMWHTQDMPEPDELFDYAHEPGVAVLHAGMHRHGAYPTLSGTRRNLIVWCRSSSYRSAGPQATCPGWCGV